MNIQTKLTNDAIEWLGNPVDPMYPFYKRLVNWRVGPIINMAIIRGEMDDICAHMAPVDQIDLVDLVNAIHGKGITGRANLRIGGKG